MNEEEKEAIEYYQNKEVSFSVDFDTEKLLKALGITEEDSFENHQIRFKTLLNLIEKLQKENDELKSENRRLKVIRYSTEYGTENIYLITKSDLVQIDINRYMIEIEDGKFVDLKQVYQENKELHKEIVRMKSLDIYKLVEDCETGQLISSQTIKNKIENLKKQDHEWTEQLSEPDSNFKFIDKQLKRIKNQIDALQELLEESEDSKDGEG